MEAQRLDLNDIFSHTLPANLNPLVLLFDHSLINSFHHIHPDLKRTEPAV